MNFEEFLKINEPELSEDELYDMYFESQIRDFEDEQAEIKAIDVWIRSFEPSEDDINEKFEDSH